MTDAMAAMLDELMGKTRNANKDEQGQKMDFNDPDVCQFALAGLCPYTLFSNTKSDLGACDWIVHEDHIEYPRLKAEYDATSDRDRESLGYGRKLYRLLFELTQEMDKKISRSKERVDKENQPRSIKPADQLKLDALQQQAKDSTDRAEVLAMEGDADGSIAMTEAADQFNEDHGKLFNDLVMPERTKSVCEICGVFINSTDNEQRRQDHINGKQYVGWKRIREQLKELEQTFGPSSRSAHVDDRGPTERDADFRRGASTERAGRRNGDERSGDRGDRGGGRGYDRGDREYSERRSGGYERGYSRRDDYHNDRGDRSGDRGYGGRDERSHSRRDEYGDRGDRGSDRYGDRGDRGSYGGDRGYGHRR